MIELKIWPIPFRAVLNGDKRYEVRKADREFAIGATIVLREFLPDTEQYTGRSFTGKITYITKSGTWGLPSDICVFGFEEIK